MYRKGSNYKIELKNGMFYTGKILDEDEINIRVSTIKNEELVLSKSEITQSKLLEVLE